MAATGVRWPAFELASSCQAYLKSRLDGTSTALQRQQPAVASVRGTAGRCGRLAALAAVAAPTKESRLTSVEQAPPGMQYVAKHLPLARDGHTSWHADLPDQAHISAVLL